MAGLEGQGFRIAPLDGLDSVFRVVHEPFPISETIEHWLGYFYIQQAATTLAAPLLDPAPGSTVLDLCAAPGGKTAHLAEWMEDRGCIVAVDLSEQRLHALVGNMSRLTHPCVISVAGDGLRLPESALFDRVLVDAPCSGEGRTRRDDATRPGGKKARRAGRAGDGPHAASRGDLRRLPRLQEALLRKALRLTAPGGRVLYMTCTLAPEENESVVDAVLRAPDDGPGGSPPCRIIPVTPSVPHARGLTSFDGARWAPEMEGARRIHPHHLDSGGLFLALIEREGEEPGLAGDEPPKLSSGWTAPGPALPGDSTRHATDPTAEAERALAALASDPAQASREVGWTWRKDALRFHAFHAWPLDRWYEEGESARIVAAGLRGFDQGAGRELTPTGDLLRWLGPRLTDLGLDLDDADWIRLLDGAELRPARPIPSELRTGSNPSDTTILTRRGAPITRGRIRGGRLHHDLPPPRARWLRRAIARSVGNPGESAPVP